MAEQSSSRQVASPMKPPSRPISPYPALNAKHAVYDFRKRERGSDDDDPEPKRRRGTASETSDEVKVPKDGKDDMKPCLGSPFARRSDKKRRARSSPFQYGRSSWPKEEREDKIHPASRSSLRSTPSNNPVDEAKPGPSLKAQTDGRWRCGDCGFNNHPSTSVRCTICLEPKTPAQTEGTVSGPSGPPNAEPNGTSRSPRTSLKPTPKEDSFADQKNAKATSDLSPRSSLAAFLNQPIPDAYSSAALAPVDDQEDIENKPPVKPGRLPKDEDVSTRHLRPSASWASVSSIPQVAPQPRTRKEDTPYPLPTDAEALDDRSNTSTDTPPSPVPTELEDFDGSDDLDDSQDEDMASEGNDTSSSVISLSPVDDDMGSESTSVAGSDMTCTCANCTWQRGDSTLFRSRPQSRLDGAFDAKDEDEEAFGEAITRIRIMAGLDDSEMDVDNAAAADGQSQAHRAADEDTVSEGRAGMPSGVADNLRSSIENGTFRIIGMPVNELVDEDGLGSRATSSTLRASSSDVSRSPSRESAIDEAAEVNTHHCPDTATEKTGEGLGEPNVASSANHDEPTKSSAAVQSTSNLAATDAAALLAAINAQATAQAASHAAFTTAIANITDQVTGLADSVKRLSERQDEQAAAEERRRDKVDGIAATVEQLVTLTEKMGTMVESIMTEVAEQKNNQNRARPMDVLGGGRDVAAQLDGMDEAILGLENKVIGLGKFLTGKVVRGVDSIPENGLQAQFDIINNRLNIQDELMDDIAGDAGSAEVAATDALERIHVIEEALGTSTIPAPAASVLGQLKSIQDRLERNLKY